MPLIRYIEHDGTEHEQEVPVGWSLMEGASKNGIPGILGDCGGSCACGTCHIYADESWLERLGPVDEGQDMMLEYAVDRAPNSRLACQITVTADMDGFIARTPIRQHTE
jgi:2Fe-2S ferredoxin